MQDSRRDDARRRSLGEQLKLRGEFSTAEAETASTALECVRHHSFDAILLDVGLSDMDGRELCRLIWKQR